MFINSIRYWVLLSIVYFLALPLNGQPRAAVVKAKYDNIERALRAMKIDYEVIKYRDLEDAAILKQYRVIFFPCGMDYPAEKNIKLLSRGKNVQSVSLRDDYYEPRKELITANVKNFIRSGGYAYFSGYSFELLNSCFNNIKFHDDFPYMGMPGRIIARLRGDLERFTLKDEMAVYMGHPGWIAVKDVCDAEIMSQAAYDTPRGEREGPISFMGYSGRGMYLYTVYHSTIYSDFRRFNIYRVLGGPQIARIEKVIFAWGQKLKGAFSDAFMEDENSRIYRIDLYKGDNTIYFRSSGYPFQIDILDSDYSLIESRDSAELAQSFDLHSRNDGYCYVRIFPSTHHRYSMYSLVSAHGVRIFPYFFKMLYAMMAVLVIAGAIVIIRIIRRRGDSGKGKLI